MAQEGVYIKIIVEQLGHKRPQTPLQTNNLMAEAVPYGKTQPKCTKAMDMCLHRSLDWKCKQQFQIYW